MLGELFNLGASVFAPSDMVQKKKNKKKTLPFRTLLRFIDLYVNVLGKRYLINGIYYK